MSGPGAQFVPYGPPALASDGLPVVPTPAEIGAWSAGRHAPKPRRPHGRLIVTIVVILFLVACGLGILWVIGQETGRTGFLLGAVLATVPVPLLVFAFRWLDQHEPEPRRFHVFAFVWGAAVATLAAIFLNTVGTALFFARPGGEEEIGWEAVLVAPPVEELAKGAVIAILALARRVNGVVDGIVYAGLVGVGFAFTENILYYGRAYADNVDELGAGGGVIITIVVFVVRGIASPFAHPLFTLPIGIAIGLAVRSRSTAVKIGFPVLGYLLAMTLHGIWNGTALRAVERGPGQLLVGYVGIMVPTFAVAIGLAIWFRRREGRVLGRRLPAFAEAGWIAPHEVALLSSLQLRQLAVDLAGRVGAKPAQQATKAYHDQVVALGFLRERLASGRAIERGLVQQHDMLQALPALRSRAVIPPPPVLGPRGGPPPWPPQIGGPPPYGPPPTYGAVPFRPPSSGPPSYGPPSYGPPSYGPPSYGPPSSGPPSSGPQPPAPPPPRNF